MSIVTLSWSAARLIGVWRSFVYKTRAKNGLFGAAIAEVYAALCCRTKLPNRLAPNPMSPVHRVGFIINRVSKNQVFVRSNLFQIFGRRNLAASTKVHRAKL